MRCSANVPQAPTGGNVQASGEVLYPCKRRQALCRTRTDDPFLTMEGRRHLLSGNALLIATFRVALPVSGAQLVCARCAPAVLVAGGVVERLEVGVALALRDRVDQVRVMAEVRLRAVAHPP